MRFNIEFYPFVQGSDRRAPNSQIFIARRELIFAYIHHLISIGFLNKVQGTR
jgi:hypothetical protein